MAITQTHSRMVSDVDTDLNGLTSPGSYGGAVVSAITITEIDA